MKTQEVDGMDSAGRTGGETLDEIFLRVGADAVRTQWKLEEISRQQEARFLEDIRSIGPSATSAPLVRELLPWGIAVKEQVIEASLEISARRTRTTSLTIQLFGKVVGTFAETRFATEKTKYSHVEVHVVPRRIDKRLRQERKE